MVLVGGYGQTGRDNGQLPAGAPIFESLCLEGKHKPFARPIREVIATMNLAELGFELGRKLLGQVNGEGG